MSEQPIVDAESLQRLRRAASVFRDSRTHLAGDTQTAARRAGPGLEFRELRPYRAGDDARRIDWRATRQRNTLIVRTHDDQLSSHWSVCLDCSASMASPDPKRWRLARQCAAALSYLLLECGHSTEFVAFAGTLESHCPGGTGRSQYIRILRSLSDAVVRRSRADLFSAVAALRPGRHLMIVSDFLEVDAMQGDLGKLGRRGRAVHALRIDSAMDARPITAERTELIDAETTQRRTVARGAHESATQLLQTLRAALDDNCARQGIRMTACTADERWQDVVLRHAGMQHDRV